MLEDDIADYKQAAEVLRDEVKRLRSALWGIAYGTGDDPAPGLDACIDIARNALNSTVK